MTVMLKKVFECFYILLIIVYLSVESSDHICTTCIWSNNLGYAFEPTNCSKYVICVRVEPRSDEFIIWTRECAPGTYWNQNFLTCTREIPPPEKCIFIENTKPIPTFEPCKLTPAETNNQYFLNGVLQTCPEFTLFFAEECACLIEKPRVCDSSVPQLRLSFENGLNDDSCNQGVAEVTGQVTINNFGPEGDRSAFFDGESMIEYASLANRGRRSEIGTGLFFRTGTIRTNTNQTLFSTSGCIDPSPYEIFISPDNRVTGIIRGENGTAVVSGSYIPFNEQVQVGARKKRNTQNGFISVFLVYDGKITILYIDGLKADEFVGPIGDIPNCQCGASVGGSLNGDPYEGSMDDVSYHDRALTQAEVQTICNCPR